MLDRDNPLTLYLQLSEILKKNIEIEEWKVGSQIPTEEELCRTYDVSRSTVRSAISKLSRDGFLQKQQGKGTFVAKKVAADKFIMSVSFDELMSEPDKNIKTSVAAQTMMMPVGSMAEQLEIAPETHLIYIKRLRIANDVPVLIQESYIPHHLCPELIKENLKNLSIFEFFEKKIGLHITGVKNNFEIIHLKAEEKKAFACTAGNPAALALIQRFFSGSSVVMFSRSVKRPGGAGFFIEFEKKI